VIILLFQNGYSSGDHGFLIGSAGGRANINVTNVLIRNSQVVNSENGVSIKNVFKTTGFISCITYKNIFLTSIDV
jgi:polygalacturonase